ncbi:hypothetical protein EHRUM2_00310, partial [Ehrlichia ruminantium]
MGIDNYDGETSKKLTMQELYKALGTMFKEAYSQFAGKDAKKDSTVLDGQSDLSNTTVPVEHESTLGEKSYEEGFAVPVAHEHESSGERSNEGNHRVLGEDEAHGVEHAVPVTHEHESSDEKSNEADHKVLGEDEAHGVEHAVPVTHEHESSDEKSNEEDHKVLGE